MLTRQLDTITDAHKTNMHTKDARIDKRTYRIILFCYSTSLCNPRLKDCILYFYIEIQSNLFDFNI